MESLLRLIFMGTPEFSVTVLRALVSYGHDVALVYTQPDSPAGRGLKVTHSPVKEAALELGLSVFEPVTLKGEDASAKVRGFDPDVVVVAAYARILPESILEIPKYGCLNVHPSLLPRHRGASPIPSAILAGDKFTGVSIMLMDEGMDTGPVLWQERIPIDDNDTTGTLTEKLSELSAELIVDVIPKWAKGEIKPCPQDNSQATYSKPITKASAEIDWDKPVNVLWQEVRAYNPWPGSFTKWQGKALKVLEATPLPLNERLEPGRVVRFDYLPENVAFGVTTGDGILGIIRIQLEGKKVLSSGEFLRGQRDFIGSILPS